MLRIAIVYPRWRPGDMLRIRIDSSIGATNFDPVTFGFFGDYRAAMTDGRQAVGPLSSAERETIMAALHKRRTTHDFADRPHRHCHTHGSRQSPRIQRFA